MKSILTPIIENLKRSELLLTTLSNDEFSNKTVGPYYSSIGGHIRHILDVYSCIFKGLSAGIVDLTARERNEIAEMKTEVAQQYLEETIQRFSNLQELSPTLLIEVIDDLGLGQVRTQYTIGAALCQAHSHTIHHFACIGYILEQLDTSIPDKLFGYNPTTPLKDTVNE